MALNNTGGFTMHNGAFNNVYGPQNITNILYHNNRLSDTPQLLQKLAERAAMNACLDAEVRYPPPKCHPNTPVKALNMLGRWVRGRDSSTTVCWVHGPAGVGKSAIAQKVSEDHPNQLCGAFFFSRRDPTRNKLDPLVATLIYQCCTSERLKTVVGPLIYDALRSNPNIFHAKSETQFRKLLLEPFSLVHPAQRRHLPNLIVIDGVDECVDISSQQRLLGMVELAIKFTTPNPFPFKFLLSSRPESLICLNVSASDLMSNLERLDISGQAVRFTGVRSNSYLDIHTWPSETKLTTGERERFVFAFAMKCVDSSDAQPQEQLKAIISTGPVGMQTPSYPTPDMLYKQILSACCHWNQVWPILRLLVTPSPDIYLVDIEWSSPAIIAKLYELKPDDVRMLLSELRLVIHVPEDNHSAIHILHTHRDFASFLLNRGRSGDYFVPKYPEAEYSNLIAVLLLRTLSSCAEFYPPYCGSGEMFHSAFIRWQDEIKPGTLLHFATRKWTFYCTKVESPSGDLLTALDGFDPYFTASALSIPYHETIQIFQAWKGCLKWAKSFERQVPQRFINRMETYFRGSYIGYNKERLRHCVIQNTFYSECGCTNLNLYDWDASSVVDSFILRYFEQWWNLKKIREGHAAFPLIVPADPHKIFPDDWVVVQVTEKNGHTVKRMYDIRESLKDKDRKKFDKDIKNDTSQSVKDNLVKEEEFAEFKALLYERRDLFARLALSPLRTPRRPALPRVPSPNMKTTLVPEATAHTNGNTVTVSQGEQNIPSDILPHSLNRNGPLAKNVPPLNNDSMVSRIALLWLRQLSLESG
ncbi:hypothetical protein VNI00_008801 [Paramarasmius palmivorus]|uniref:Nephrocystin 3-like N-terminal domain-containing protein n=1 Tax=Paramarasmius palmivorus TaxID=297713 RepID=A0AAW0CX13_9AGAR